MIADQIAVALYADLNYFCPDLQKEKRLWENLLWRKTFAEIWLEKQR